MSAGEKRNCFWFGTGSSSNMTTITRKGNTQARTTGDILREQRGSGRSAPSWGKRRVRGYTGMKGSPQERKQRVSVLQPPPGQFRAQGAAGEAPGQGSHRWQRPEPKVP